MADILVMKSKGKHAPEPEKGKPDTEKLVKGKYHTRTWNHFTGEDDRLYCGIWESTPGKVNVDYKGDANTPATSILYVPEGKAGCDANGGWYYDNPSSPKAIHLCEASCIDVQKTTTGKVNVKFGCATVAK